MERKNRYINALKSLRLGGSRVLTVIAVTVVLFNVISTKVLPRDIFLVYASDINTLELVNLANSEREAMGISKLTIDTRLVKAAYNKGEDMFDKQYWAHYGPNGESPWDFITGAGYEYSYAGENLAKDFSSTAPIHRAWMESPSHRSNIVNENFENIGIAVVYGEFDGEETSIVVQMFGTPEEEKETEIDQLTTSTVQSETSSDYTAPIITEPSNGDILDTGAFDIKGIANEGSEVNLYDYEELIGAADVVTSEFVFRYDQTYTEGTHIFSAKASISGNNMSSPSKDIEVIVDTIDPYIDSSSARFDAVEIGQDYKSYIFSVYIQDNPIQVHGLYQGEEFSFYKNEDRWNVALSKDEDGFADLHVEAVDAAGNKSEETFESGFLGGLEEGEVLDDAESYQTERWNISSILSRIFTRSIRGQINFFIILIMILLLAVEQFALARTGYTKGRSSSFLHIPVFVILLFLGLLGGGGQIL